MLNAHIIQNASYMLRNEFCLYLRFCRVKELFASDLWATRPPSWTMDEKNLEVVSENLLEEEMQLWSTILTLTLISVSWSCHGMTLLCIMSNRSTKKEALVSPRWNHLFVRVSHSKLLSRWSDLQTRLSSQLIWTRFQSKLLNAEKTTWSINLFRWVGSIPDDVVADMAEIAPMLVHFGYDPEGNPPNYGEGVNACLIKIKSLRL